MASPAAPLAAAPRGPVPIPAAVSRLARGGEITPVWQNSLGGLTFRIADPEQSGAVAQDRFVKWTPKGTPELDVAAEATRTTWAAASGARVPEVMAYDSDETGEWLVTRAVAGDSAVSPQWLESPRVAARALGEGLRELHSRLDPTLCPFTWSADDRLAQAELRVAAGDGPETWSPDHRHLTPGRAMALLSAPPPIDRLVVCHGDPCAPNTLLAPDGTFAAHVDLGDLGSGDRWADLAVAAWSTEWNYGPGFEAEVYAGYGVSPDPERIAYYRLLWDLS